MRGVCSRPPAWEDAPDSVADEDLMMVSHLTGRDHLTHCPIKLETSNFVVIGSEESPPSNAQRRRCTGEGGGEMSVLMQGATCLHLVSQIPSLHPWSSPGGSDRIEWPCFHTHFLSTCKSAAEVVELQVLPSHRTRELRCCTSRKVTQSCHTLQPHGLYSPWGDLKHLRAGPVLICLPWYSVGQQQGRMCDSSHVLSPLDHQAFDLVAAAGMSSSVPIHMAKSWLRRPQLATGFFLCVCCTLYLLQ